MTMRRPTPPTRQHRAYSLLELLIVVVIIGIASAVAFPSLRTFMARTGDVSEATRVARFINEARDMARRRNRAYVVEFTVFDEGQPRGVLTVREGATGSCLGVIAALDANSREIGEPSTFGETIVGGRSSKHLNIGLRGWVGSDGEFADRQTDDLTLCLSPDGSAKLKNGANTVTPITDRVGIFLQKFTPDAGGWSPDGPPRVVGITFSGGAQLELN